MGWAALVVAIIGAIAGADQQQKARKEQKQAQKEQRRESRLANIRERRAQIRQDRVKRAELLNAEAVSGFSGSGMQTESSSVGAQVGSNLALIEGRELSDRKIQKHLDKANTHTARASDIAAFTSVVTSGMNVASAPKTTNPTPKADVSKQDFTARQKWSYDADSGRWTSTDNNPYDLG